MLSTRFAKIVFTTCIVEMGYVLPSFAQSSSLLPMVHYNLEEASRQPEQVHHLDLSYQGLTEFPKEILEMKHLVVLNLAGNHISDLPVEIARLALLEEICLDNNLFAVFPEPVLQLPDLQVLSLKGNGSPVDDYLETLALQAPFAR